MPHPYSLIYVPGHGHLIGRCDKPASYTYGVWFVPGRGYWLGYGKMKFTQRKEEGRLFDLDSDDAGIFISRWGGSLETITFQEPQQEIFYGQTRKRYPLCIIKATG